MRCQSHFFVSQLLSGSAHHIMSEADLAFVCFRYPTTCATPALAGEHDLF